MYITKKKKRRNRKKKRYYCRARIGRWPHGGLIYSAISLCGRKYATGILISNRRRHSRALNRPAPLSIQCSLDMDRCIVQLPLTCLVALPIDNIKRYIENISSRPREGQLWRAYFSKFSSLLYHLYFFLPSFLTLRPFVSSGQSYHLAQIYDSLPFIKLMRKANRRGKVRSACNFLYWGRFDPNIFSPARIVSTPLHPLWSSRDNGKLLISLRHNNPAIRKDIRDIFFKFIAFETE